MIWRNLRLLSLSLLVFGLLSAGRAAPAAGTKWAVLVGIDKYRSKDISTLNYATADVKSVAKDLVQYDGFPEDHVFVMTSDVQDESDPNCPYNNNVMDRLTSLSQLIGSEDTFLFYFAGHGFQRGEGKEFLGTVNTDPTSLFSLRVTTLPLQDLREEMKTIQAKKVVFIIDACRSDPEAQRRGDTPNKQTATFTRDLQDVATASAAGAAGTAVLFACSEGQRSWEWPEHQHGAFTYFLSQGLEGKAAERDGTLTMIGLGRYVQKRMLDWGIQHNADQTPDLEQQGPAEIVLGRLTPGGSHGDTGGGGGDGSGGGAADGGEVTPVGTIAHLHIDTTPSGADIFVNGDPQKKTTSCTLDFDLKDAKSQEVEIAARLLGYHTIVRTVTINRGESLPLDWKFQVQIYRTVNPTDGAEMVYVPPGEFIMGSDDSKGDEKPQRVVTLDAYYIYKNPVTVAQYRKFCQAAGRKMPPDPPWGWKDTDPIVNVSWEEASTYSKWARVNLPTEAQWEKAARGMNARTYPWGFDWEPDNLWCSTTEPRPGTNPVGSFPAGTSPYGCLDMAGNVLQWCSDWYAEDFYQTGPDKNPTGPETGTWRVLRGGSWEDDTPNSFRCSSRFKGGPQVRYTGVGFRCAVGVGK